MRLFALYTLLAAAAASMFLSTAAFAADEFVLVTPGTPLHETKRSKTSWKIGGENPTVMTLVRKDGDWWQIKNPVHMDSKRHCHARLYDLHALEVHFWVRKSDLARLTTNARVYWPSGEPAGRAAEATPVPDEPTSEADGRVCYAFPLGSGVPKLPLYFAESDIVERTDEMSLPRHQPPPISEAQRRRDRSGDLSFHLREQVTARVAFRKVPTPARHERS